MIVVQLLGGLGNQMFQYAIGRSLSLLNGSKLFLDGSFLSNRVYIPNFVYRNFDLDIFGIDLIPPNVKEFIAYPQDVSIKSIYHRLVHYCHLEMNGYSYIKEWSSRFNSNLTQKKGNIYLDGYWQNLLYFKDIEDVLKNDFTVKENLLDTSIEISDLIKNSNSVCLNVRRGDFVTDKNLIVYGVDYINNAINEICKIVKAPVFFVFSDDMSWCEQNIKIKYPTFFVTHEHKGYKFSNYLKLMILCKHFIIPNSTFAFWAAWLSPNQDKNVVCPLKWSINQKIQPFEVTPDNWIRI